MADVVREDLVFYGAAATTFTTAFTSIAIIPGASAATKPGAAAGAASAAPAVTAFTWRLHGRGSAVQHT